MDDVHDEFVLSIFNNFLKFVLILVVMDDVHDV